MTAPNMIGPRLLSYIRWQKSIQYLGAGIGGLAVFGSLLNSAFAQSSNWLRAGFIIAIILAAVVNGRAYYSYVARESFLREYMYETKQSETTDVPAGKDYEYPESARFSYFLAGVIAAIAAAILITATLWSSISLQGSRECTANLVHDGSTLVCTGN